MVFLKYLLKKGFDGSDWDFPNQKLEMLAPHLNDYEAGKEQPIPPASLIFNGTDMTDVYMNEYLEPRINLFNQFAEDNSELKAISRDNRHPLSRLAEERANMIAGESQLEAHSIEEQANIHASLSTLVIDGFIVALVEKKLSGLPDQSANHGLSIQQVSSDCLIVTAYRNWAGDAREAIDIMVNWPVEAEDVLVPPPFGPAPHEPHWGLIRYLIDYGFYCGTVYLGMGRRQFEKTMSSIP